jgi:hypothetical protein
VHVTRDPQQLSDERRYDVPVTVISTEFTSEMLREWTRACATAELPSCVAKQVTRPIRNREARVTEPHVA